MLIRFGQLSLVCPNITGANEFIIHVAFRVDFGTFELLILRQCYMK